MFSKLFKKKKAEKTSVDAKASVSLHDMAQELCDLLKADGAVLENDDRVFVPNYDLKIRIEAERVTDHDAVLNFILDCPKWDRQLFECCASFGPNMQQAVGLALGNFALCLFSGVCAMHHGKEKHRLETTFEGKKHRWAVYQSNLITMCGDPNNESAMQDYWSMLEPHLSNYLGDSKICYIKIYGGSVNHEITGECRINNLKIDELSEQVGNIFADLNVSNYITNKQFFLLVQDDDTCHPYPYTQDQITEKLRVALSVFQKLLPEEDGYDRCQQELVKQLGDPHLAAEIFSFLPELCAQWQFPNLQPTETLTISFDQEMHQYRISQITAFYMLMCSLHHLILAGEMPRNLFGQLISISAAWGVICSAKQDGTDLTKSGGPIHTIYSFPDGYIAR